jgi:alpha-L-fucosidase 2
MHEKGKKVAEEMYGCRGFVAHHNTDLWGDCAPQDIYIPASYWVMGGAWLCTHIWTHYLYTKDEAFLREMYPVLRDAVLFFEDFLVRRGEYYVTCPSVSPENTYILPSGVKGSVCAGPQWIFKSFVT